MKRILTFVASAAVILACALTAGCSKQNTEDKSEPENGTDTTPTITWASNPDFAPLYLTEDADVELVVTAPEGIETFIVDLNTESTAIKLVLTLLGMSTTFDLINNEAVVTLLSNYGIPVGDELYGQTEVTFVLSEFVSMLATVGLESGLDFEITVTVTDAKGQSVSKTVTIIQP